MAPPAAWMTIEMKSTEQKIRRNQAGLQVTRVNIGSAPNRELEEAPCPWATHPKSENSGPTTRISPPVVPYSIALKKQGAMMRSTI